MVFSLGVCAPLAFETYSFIPGHSHQTTFSGVALLPLITSTIIMNSVTCSEAVIYTKGSTYYAGL